MMTTCLSCSGVNAVQVQPSFSGVSRRSEVGGIREGLGEAQETRSGSRTNGQKSRNMLFNLHLDEVPHLIELSLFKIGHCLVAAIHGFLGNLLGRLGFEEQAQYEHRDRC
jgi:hypothetical protein